MKLGKSAIFQGGLISTVNSGYIDCSCNHHDSAVLLAAAEKPNYSILEISPIFKINSPIAVNRLSRFCRIAASSAMTMT